MKLIHFKGLNCFFNCALSIAAYMGVNYEDSFATLWSETDLAYDSRHNAYSSKRMLANLETMGAKVENLGCASEGERAESLSTCRKRSFLIAGMDAFYIPWSPIYHALHDAHYFIAQKERPDSFCCFDPTYNREYMRLTPGDIVSHAYDLRGVDAVVPNAPLRVGVIEEAREIIRNHPQTREKLLGEIGECAGEGRENASLLARYTAALIDNRYLYRRYLRNFPAYADAHRQFFDKDFFSRWEAVKNGLYKASLIRGNEGVVDEVCEVLTDLMNREMALAGQIAAMGVKHRR